MISQTENGIFISQKKYAENILKKFNLLGCKSVATPLIANEKMRKFDGAKKADAKKYRSLVGSFLYLTATRPDIMFAASLLSRYMQEPSQIHFRAAKRVLRYLQGTLDYGILFTAVEKSRLIGYTDSDWAGCLDDMKSTSAYVFSLGSGICSWASKKQNVVAQSTAEAEYIAAAKAASQAVWLRRILEDIGEKQEGGTKLYCDNKSAIAIGKNPVSHDRTKHIAIKYHFIRESIEKGEVALEYAGQRSSWQTYSPRHFHKRSFAI
ncbi:NAD(P)-binding Rossmann-fold superfamily protein [Prunus dulcis]|uniref:NAD(P)-binding Rossmann-fold superfamily protein n=1 Tax=Prunus dulcis TaxID=3755 RepID=A0A4Y1QR30_PRUDU|nr:NAD(P)-binding Rossmann-fold superfamily protein [Prunus dulcis]